MDDWQATRRRYLGVLGAVGTAGLAGCSEQLESNPFASVDEATRERYVGVATRTAAELEEWHRERSRTTRLLAQADMVRNGTPDEQQGWLEREAEQLPDDVYRVHLADPSDWTVVASNSPARVGAPLNTREAPWQTDSIQYGENGVFASEATEALTLSLVSFVTPVTEGERQERLVVQTSVDEVARTLQQPAGDVYSQIVDADGRVVAGTREVQALERNDGRLSEYLPDGDSEALERALDGGSGFVEEPAINDRDGDGEDYVVAYAPVENRDWAVLTHVPRETAQSG